MCSTTYFDGLALAVETGANRPVVALRPILNEFDPLLLFAISLHLCFIKIMGKSGAPIFRGSHFVTRSVAYQGHGASEEGQRRGASGGL
jgi:hypothetical protein